MLLDEAPKHLNANAKEMLKGLAFGGLAASWVMVETTWIVFKDIFAVAGPGIIVKASQWGAKKVIFKGVKFKFLPPIANPSAQAKRYVDIGEQIASSGLTVKNGVAFFFEAKEIAERISVTNMKIKRLIYGND